MLVAVNSNIFFGLCDLCSIYAFKREGLTGLSCVSAFKRGSYSYKKHL